MGAQLLTVIYRTAEKNNTYQSVFTITFDWPVAKFHGLDRPIKRSCRREVTDWLRSIGCTAYTYDRYKRGQKIPVIHELRVSDGE